MWSIHCPKCNMVTKMLTIKESCAFMEISRRTVYNWIQSGALHVRRNPGGHVLICSMSLLAPHNSRSHNWSAVHQL
jgi:excisionase family DNA binding protein